MPWSDQLGLMNGEVKNPAEPSESVINPHKSLVVTNEPMKDQMNE